MEFINLNENINFFERTKVGMGLELTFSNGLKTREKKDENLFYTKSKIFRN